MSMNVSSISSNELYLQSLLSKQGTDAGSSAAASGDVAGKAVSAAQADTAELSADTGAKAAVAVKKAAVSDSVEISAEGLQYLAAQKSSSAQTPVSAVKTEEAEDESTGTDLSAYTVVQLQQMLDDGQITKAEYSAEITKRKAEEVETAE